MNDHNYSLMSRPKQATGGVSCCVPLCKSKKCLQQNVKWYRIPADKKLRKKWLIKINRYKFTPSRHHRVCSLHFTGGAKTYDINIPTIFPWTKPVVTKRKPPTERKPPAGRKPQTKRKSPAERKPPTERTDNAGPIETDVVMPSSQSSRMDDYSLNDIHEKNKKGIHPTFNRPVSRGMDILQGYESSDSNEETSDTSSCDAKSKGLDEIIDNTQEKNDQKNTHLESVDFFSLSSTQFDESELPLKNGPTSSLQSRESIDAFHMERYQEPLRSSTCLQWQNQETPGLGSYSNASDGVMCTTQDYFVADDRVNLDLKHRSKTKRQNPWDRSNKKLQKHAQNHSVITDDLQPYVSNKKRISSVSDEKCKDKTTMACNMFTTPTLIAANLKKEQLWLPRTKYVTFDEAHSAAVTHARWNIPRYSHLLLSASFDKSVKIWDCVDFNTCVSSIKSHTNGVKDAQWSKCGLQILSGGFDKSIKLHDVQTGTCLNCFPTSSAITCLQFHPTEPNLFLAGTYGSAIYSFDINSGKVVNEYKGNFGEVLDVEFLSNGYEFASATSIVGRDSANRTLMVWDFKAAAVVSNQLYHEKYTCPSLKAHPKENVFLAQSNANYIAMFSSRRPYKLNKFKRFEGHRIEGYPIGFGFSPDGNVIASGSSDGCVYFYNYKTSKLIKKLSCYDDDVCIDVGCHPVLPGVIVTCSWKGRLTVWQ